MARPLGAKSLVILVVSLASKGTSPLAMSQSGGLYMVEDIAVDTLNIKILWDVSEVY